MRRAGAEIRLTLHLMELTAGGSTRFSNIYQATVNNIFATQEHLAEEICRDISAALHIGERVTRASTSFEGQHGHDHNPPFARERRAAAYGKF